MAAPTTTGRHRVRAAVATSGYRPDVQGLRALAVLLVVGYHLYPHRVPGGYIGVDVFFVISGFLITGHLLRTYRRSGHIGFLDFYGRRARRLLPAAVLVLSATWVASRLILPSAQLPDTARQIRASALYFQNWVLAHDAVDYLKLDAAATPVQHFWSLSVEEQFYLIWPLLFLAAAIVARRRSRVTGHAVALGLAVVVVGASLWYSDHETRHNPAAAYFVTTTRIWELGLGGLLALLPRRVVRRFARLGPLGWVALVAVVASAFVISGTSDFPGYLALWPVVGAVVLIACGSTHARWGPARLTSLRPAVFVGDISYALYLWHWPIIVLWKAESGGSIGRLDGPAILAVSILLSWLTKVLVEDPVRRAPFIARHRWRSLATALIAAVPAAAAWVYLAQLPAPFAGHLDSRYPGAAVLAGDATAPTGVAAVPPLATAVDDIPQYEKQGCEVVQSSRATTICRFGDTAHPTLRVALVGDSVVGQWETALAAIATRRHWEIITAIHALCPLTATMTVNLGDTAPYTVCHDWGAAIQKQLLTTIKPDIMLTSERPVLGIPGDPKADATSFAAIAAGMVTNWKQLQAAGIAVVPLREPPEMHKNIPDCLSAHGATVSSCSTVRSSALKPGSPIDRAVAMMHGAVQEVDMNRYICPSTVCAPIVGNVLVYRDKHHLTSTYTRTVEPYLERALLATTAFRGG